MKPASEYRALARKQLGGSIFSNMWLLTMLAFIITSAILSFSSIIVVGPLLLYGPIYYGLYRATVKTARGETKLDFNDLLSAKEDVTNTILLGLLQNIFIALWSMLFVIPGIVKSYSYSMASYIQQDSADKSWKFCIDESRRIMNGHKMQLFILDLTFIGWYILGSLLFGIGMLFVVPYHYQARANFYCDLVSSQVFEQQA